MKKYKVRVRDVEYGSKWTTSLLSSTLDEIVVKHPLIGMTYNRNQIEALTIKGSFVMLKVPLNRVWAEVSLL